MASLVAFEYDLFVIHAKADEPFVHGHLLPAVGLAPERVMLSSELELGAIKVVALERGVLSSRLTVVVLSPAYAADRLAELAELLAGHASGATGRLVPLLRADCELPLRLDFRVALDFRDPAHWAEEGQKLRAHLQQPVPAPVDVPCPYPGMRPYSADTAAHFYGRDAEIDELIGRLRAGEREIYVIGPSGSGKSSLVAAGLLPRLRRGVSGLGSFLTLSLRPGEHPTTRLGAVLEASEGELSTPASAVEALLARSTSGASVLIVFDQLEELFTLASADERAKLLVAVRALRAESRCVLVFTLRADFYGAFMESPLWKDLHGRLARIEVGPLGDEELRVVIARPARDVGVYFEPELIERLLADAASEPGILPLLQETLVQLWDQRRRRLLTLADYQALGDGGRSGLAIALARRADAALRALTPAQEAIARRILLRLVSFGEGRSNTRRQQPRSKLRAAGDDATDFDIVLRRLIDDRLLTADEDDHGGEARVDLAHETMITAWPTLAGWIRTHRADEQRRRQLEATAAQWVEHGRGARGLLDLIDLAEAEAWQRTESAHELGESADVAALIAASRAAQDRQRRRRRGLVWSAFATLAVFAIVVGTLAVVARHRASEAETSHKQADADRAQAQADRVRTEAGRRAYQLLLAQSYQETGRQLLLDSRALEAIPYLVAARQKGEEGEPLRMLFWTAARSLLLTHQGAVTDAAFSPDGTRIVTTSDHTAQVWDAASGQLLVTPLAHLGLASSIWAVSPDGTRVVTASFDNTARVWDAASGQLLATLQHQGWVSSVAFSPDRTRVITVSHGTTRVWDAATGKPLSILQHQGLMRRAAFSPDGTRVVTASHDGTARVWDAATGKPLAPPLQHQDEVSRVAFNPDGTRVVTVSGNTARVWDAATGKPLAPPLQHQKPVGSAAFSPDGTRVVTASSDKTARVWDIDKLVTPLQHQDDVLSAAFSPDGTRVVTASRDGTARVWDAATGKPLASPLQYQDEVKSAVFSPDGTRVVTASNDGTAQIWDAATGKPLATPLIHHEVVFSAAFSPDGTRVVTASNDKTAQVWDAATGKPLAPPLQHQGPVRSAAFSPDGTRVVTASDDKTARVWDAATGKPLAPSLQHQGEVYSAAFSPDGTRVVTASLYNARVWNAATGKPLGPPLQHQGKVYSAAFSPGGTRVVTASDDKTARVWDATSGQPLSTPLVHQDSVSSAAFSPDGTRVVTASSDKTARVWDAATGKPLAPPLQHQGEVWSAAFSPDGTRVVTTSDGHTARVWETGLDKRTLAEWSKLAERSPFVLSGSVHVLREPPAPDTGSGTD